MTRLRAGLLAALVTIACASPAGAQAPQSPTDVVDAFHEALQSGDRRRALEQLAADVLVFEQGRIDRSRTDYAREHLGEDIGFASSTKHTVLRRAAKVQGSVAWIMSVNRTRGRFRDRNIDLTTDETIVLTRVGNKWRIVHIHWSFDDRAVH